jgi:signal transduction histidine kinase
VTCAAYHDSVKSMTGTTLPASRAPTVTLQAGRGLIQVLIGPDPAPAWRSPWQRRAVFAALAVATPLLCLASLASLANFAVVSGVFTNWHRVTVNQVFIGPHAHARTFQVASAGPLLMPLRPMGMIVLGVLVAVAVVVPLPMAARYPLLGWRLAWLALVLAPLLHISWWGAWPWGPVQLVVLVVLFCAAGVRHPRPVLAWVWALTLAGFWLHGYARPGLLSGVLFSVAFTAAAVAVDAAGSRRRAQQAAAGQAERAELEQARRTVLEERAKIAREMHDVVAHHMSLIAVRAETAPYRLAGLPAPVAEEFGSLSGAAREALADMRRLLGVLRQDEPAALAPQPQLADLPVLVEAARQAGVMVALSSQSACNQVPAGIGVCAYRIVQESLSNASRHAPGAAVTVSVDHDAGAVLLRVANGPGQSPEGSWPTAGAGQGLAGMRERVALLGGSLSAGRSPDGGFVVSAVLPLKAAA